MLWPEKMFFVILKLMLKNEEKNYYFIFIGLIL